MTTFGNFYTVNEAHHYLKLNGVSMSAIWIRTLIGSGKIKSDKKFSSRVIPQSEITRIIREHKAKKKVKMVGA